MILPLKHWACFKVVSATQYASASLGAALIPASPLKARFSISQNLLEMVLSQNSWKEQNINVDISFQDIIIPIFFRIIITPSTAMKFRPKFFWKWSFFDQNHQPLKGVEPFERFLRALSSSYHNARTNSLLFSILEILLTGSDCFYVISDYFDSFFWDLHAFRHWTPPEICQVE